MVGAVECGLVGCDGGGMVFSSNLDFMVNVTNSVLILHLPALSLVGS